MFLLWETEKQISLQWTHHSQKNCKNFFFVVFLALIYVALRQDVEADISEPTVVLEESDSDEDIIVAYKELYQLNTAVTKHTTTSSTRATQEQDIYQNIAEQEGEGLIN